ncbi:Ger(x)C family spore germination protein [Paenibacillus sp. LjRoot56]
MSYWVKHLKLYLLAICGAVLVLLTGCWDRREVNDLALILGVASDKKDNDTIELSVQVFIPKSAGGGPSEGMSSGGGAGQTFVRSATGVTMADAMSKLREKFPRELFWGHDKVFIIGEKMAKEGVSDMIDFMMRFPQARVRLRVFACHGSARHVLELIPPLEQSTAEVLREMLELHSVVDVPIKTFAQALAGKSGAAALPWLEIVPPEPNKNEFQTVPFIKGTAVFKKDKMVERIDERITKGVVWIRNEIKKEIVTVPSQDGNGFVTVNVKSSKTELVPDIQNNQWSIKVNVKPEARVIENTMSLSLKDPEFSKAIEQNLNTTIEKRVRNALAQVQGKMHADIVGFAETFYRKYPKEWEAIKDQWDEQFPKVQVYVQVASKLLSPGIADTGISRPEKEVKKK